MLALLHLFNHTANNSYSSSLYSNNTELYRLFECMKFFLIPAQTICTAWAGTVCVNFDADLVPQDLLLRFQYSNTHTHGL